MAFVDTVNRMLAADLEKVGPKGYIHGWIHVGTPDVGADVFHPRHGKGKVTRHDEHGHVHVRFDSGKKRSFGTAAGSGGAGLVRRKEHGSDEFTRHLNAASAASRRRDYATSADHYRQAADAASHPTIRDDMIARANRDAHRERIAPIPRSQPSSGEEFGRVQRHLHVFTSEERAQRLGASSGVSYEHRRDQAEYVYTHPDLPGREFRRQSDAAEAGFRHRLAQQANSPPARRAPATVHNVDETPRLQQVNYRDLQPGDVYTHGNATTGKPVGPVRTVTRVEHLGDGASMIFHENDPYPHGDRHTLHTSPETTPAFRLAGDGSDKERYNAALAARESAGLAETARTREARNRELAETEIAALPEKMRLANEERAKIPGFRPLGEGWRQDAEANIRSKYGVGYPDETNESPAPLDPQPASKFDEHMKAADEAVAAGDHAKAINHLLVAEQHASDKAGRRGVADRRAVLAAGAMGKPVPTQTRQRPALPPVVAASQPASKYDEHVQAADAALAAGDRAKAINHLLAAAPHAPDNGTRRVLADRQTALAAEGMGLPVPKDVARRLAGGEPTYSTPRTAGTANRETVAHPAFKPEGSSEPARPAQPLAHNPTAARLARETELGAMTPGFYTRLLGADRNAVIHPQSRRVVEAMQANGWVAVDVRPGGISVWQSPDGARRMTMLAGADKPTFMLPGGRTLSGRAAIAHVVDATTTNPR